MLPDPYASMTFAEKVQAIQKQRDRTKQDNVIDKKERMDEYIESKQNVMIIQLIIQDMFYNGDNCQIIHFRDISHTFQQKHELTNQVFEQNIQQLLRQDIINILSVFKIQKALLKQDDPEQLLSTAQKMRK